MKNLMTQKFALGVLMMFVLALGVVEVADALTLTKDPAAATSGDLRAIEVNGDSFSITVGVTPTAAVNITNSNNQRVAQSSSTRINDNGYKIVIVDVSGTAATFRRSAAAGKSGYRATVGDESTTPNNYRSTTGAYVVDGTDDTAADVVDSQGRAVFTDTGLTSRLQAIPDDPVAVALRQHYNEQAVKIDIPSGIILTGTYAVLDSTGQLKHSDVTLTQTVESQDGSKFPFPTGTSITVTGYATSAGEKTISITDATPSADRPSGDSAADAIPFTIYVTQRPTSDTTSITLLGLRNGYSQGNYGHNPVKIYSGSGNHPVTYTVIGGEVSMSKKHLPAQLIRQVQDPS